MLNTILRPVRVDRSDGLPSRVRPLFTTASLVLQGAVRMVISIAVGRLAGPEALGQVTAALATASILSLLWPSATGAAASRFIAAGQGSTSPRESKAAAAWLARRTLQATLLLAPLASAYWLLRGGSLGEALVLAALTAGLGGYAFVRGVHTGSRQLLRLVVWDSLASFGGILGTLLMLQSGWEGPMVLLPLALAYLGLTAAGWPYGVTGRPDATGDLDHFVMWSSLGTVASAGLIHFTMIVAEERLDPIEAGHFAASLNLVAPAALLANAFSMVLFPSLAAAFAAGDKGRALMLTRKATDGLIAVMVLIFGGLVLLAPWVVALLWSEAFRDTANVFAVLAIGPLLRAVSMPAVTSLSSRERAGVRASATSTLLGVGVAAAFWLLPWEGWVPVALGYSMAMSATAGRLVLRAWLQDRPAWGGSWARFGLACAVVGGVTWLRESHDWGLDMMFVLTLALAGVWVLIHLRTMRSLLRKET